MTSRWLLLAKTAIALGLIAGGATVALAQGPFVAPPPGFTPADVPVSGNTLWHSLGIPQGFRKVEDATVNSDGNNPEDERTPPLTRIADPANAQSSNPAIKKAAEIKQEEDQKQQKIKAIKYLATIGCCSYKGVIEALSDALEDPTEEVRFEAAQAIVDLVCYNSAPCIDKCPENPCEHHPFQHDDDGKPCCIKKCVDKLEACLGLGKKKEKHHQCQLSKAAERNEECGCDGGGEGGCACNKCGSCCNEELTKKLAERAYGKDDKCCWLEPSTRVRAMEMQALHCCCPGGPETPTEVTPEHPIETPHAPDRPPESVSPTRPEVPGAPPSVVPPPPMPVPPPELKIPPQAMAPRQQSGGYAQVMIKRADGTWAPANASPNATTANNPRNQMASAATGAPGYLAPVPGVRSLPSQAAPKTSNDVADMLLPAPPADFERGADGKVIAPTVNRASAMTTGSPVAASGRMSGGSVAVATRDSAPAAMTPAPAARIAAPVAPTNASVASTSEDGKLVYGKIAEIDPSSRSVLLSFPHGAEPPVGTVLSAHHNYLLGAAEVGLLEVVSSRSGRVVAQPAGTLLLGKISREDEVVYRSMQ